MTAYDQLCAYTLNLGDPEFLHQLVVDAHTAQNANDSTKPMSLVFALLGLYLPVEKNISGRQVQRFHMQLANLKIRWKRPPLPSHRGTITVDDVMAKPPGSERNLAIHAWCASVWSTYAAARPQIIEIVDRYLDVA
jgi:hypothetical protein